MLDNARATTRRVTPNDQRVDVILSNFSVLLKIEEKCQDHDCEHFFSWQENLHSSVEELHYQGKYDKDIYSAAIMEFDVSRKDIG